MLVNMATLKEAVSTLLKNGAKRVDNVLIKSASVSHDESVGRKVTITFDKGVPGYKYADDSKTTLEEAERHRIDVFDFIVIRALEDNEDISILSDDARKDDDVLRSVLHYSQVNVVCEFVAAGQVHVNPFTGKEDTRVPDQDEYRYYLCDYKPGKFAYGIVKEKFGFDPRTL